MALKQRTISRIKWISGLSSGKPIVRISTTSHATWLPNKAAWITAPRYSLTTKSAALITSRTSKRAPRQRCSCTRKATEATNGQPVCRCVRCTLQSAEDLRRAPWRDSSRTAQQTSIARIEKQELTNADFKPKDGSEAFYP